MARQRIVLAKETDTTHTRVFDVAQGLPWPAAFPARALTNAFSDRWFGHEDDLAADPGARRQLQEARQSEDYSIAYIYAGQSAGIVDRVEPASGIVMRMAAEAETCLRAVGRIVQ